MIDAFTSEMVTQIVARDVATGVEMARSLGYKMPVEFDVGVRVVSRDLRPETWRTVVRIRLGDVTYDSILMVPRTDGTVPLAQVAKLWKEALDRLRSDALTMGHVWLDKHPEARNQMSNGALKVALSKLDLMKENEAAYQRWANECADRAKQLDYKARR